MELGISNSQPGALIACVMRIQPVISIFHNLIIQHEFLNLVRTCYVGVSNLMLLIISRKLFSIQLLDDKTLKKIKTF